MRTITVRLTDGSTVQLKAAGVHLEGQVLYFTDEADALVQSFGSDEWTSWSYDNAA